MNTNKLAKSDTNDEFKLRRLVEKAKLKQKRTDASVKEAIAQCIIEMEQGISYDEFAKLETRQEIEQANLKVEIPLDIQYYAIEILEEHSI